MVKRLIRGIHKAVNRATNTVPPNMFYLCAFQYVIAYSAVAQTAESRHRFVELGLFGGQDIVSNFHGLAPDAVDSVLKLMFEFVREPFSPGSKSLHESSEFVYPSLSGDFGGALGISAVPSNGEEMADKGSNKTAAEKGHQGLQEALCGGFVWHFVLSVLGGLTGYGAISMFREWRRNREERSLYKTHTDGHPNTQNPLRSIWQSFRDFLLRRWWRYQRARTYRIAGRIIIMGQENHHAQPFLNVAKDNLYMAAREFHLMGEWWSDGKLVAKPRKPRSVGHGGAKL